MKTLKFILFFSIAFYACDKDDSENVTACFSYNLAGVTSNFEDSVKFTNCSTNATSYLWDFGDETTSTQESPIHVFSHDFPYTVKLTAKNGSDSDVLIDTIWGWTVVYKPNIYIYPTETISLCVNVGFPKSGNILASEPEYNNGWCVTVDPNGKINGTYDFLFYESIQPNIWQTQLGWCVSKNNLESFFSDILTEYNLSTSERADFLEYWTNELTTHDYFLIYPQLKEIINRVITLNFSQKPENIFRLYFAFKGVNESQMITAPDIIPANRNGYNVIEWGGVIL